MEAAAGSGQASKAKVTLGEIQVPLEGVKQKSDRT